LGQLLEEDLRRGGVLLAARRELAGVDAPLAQRKAREAAHPPQEVRVGRGAHRGGRLREAREPQEARTLHHVVRQRRDGARRQLVVALPRKDHVLVPEVALAHALDAAPPALGCQALGVVVQGEEVEPGAVAREVAGVGRRMGALASEDRQPI
jgi:hypothetical protein